MLLRISGLEWIWQLHSKRLCKGRIYFAPYSISDFTTFLNGRSTVNRNYNRAYNSPYLLNYEETEATKTSDFASIKKYYFK